MRHLTRWLFAFAALLLVAAFTSKFDAFAPSRLFGQAATPPARDFRNQSAEEVTRKSEGCVTCHTPDKKTMHEDETVKAGCTDCHGGNPAAKRDASLQKGTSAFDQIKNQAHVQPRLGIWPTSANPSGNWYRALEESAEYVQFVNPGDLRVADRSCGGTCHPNQVRAAEKSMMRHGGTLWGAALYNNGAFPSKTTMFGEFYMPDGTPAIGYTSPPPSRTLIDAKGVVPSLQPLFPFQVTQPGNLLRIFESGGERPLEQGVPDPNEPPGRPRNRFSDRGLGTLNRTDPVFIGLQKTRLFDPTTNFTGSNDNPGDFRGGGCTSCHVVYANDRSRVHSGAYAAAGNLGQTQSTDPMIPKNESGHPITHKLTNAIPTSQCMTCHMHPGTNMVTPYLGLTWWDNETDGAKMYPAKQVRKSNAERDAIEQRNPEGSALRGLWSDPKFLAATGTPEFNRTLSQTQFADFHSHGWLFRAVFKRDRKGNLVDGEGKPVTDSSSAALGEAVALLDTRPAGETRAPQGHPPRARHAVRRLPLRRGQPRERPVVRRAARRGRHHVRRLPRHDAAARDAEADGPRRA
jgi:hypothetical protein